MERKWAYSGLAVMYRTQPDLPRSLAMARRAQAIDPELLPALGNLVHAHYRLGHDAAAVDGVNRFEAAFDRAPEGIYDARISRANLIATQALKAAILRDPSAIERHAAEMDKLGSTSSFAANAGLARGEAASMRHDHKGAAAQIARLRDTLGPEQWPGLDYAAAVEGLVRAADLRDLGGVAGHVAQIRAAGVRLPSGENPQTFRLRRQSDLAIALGRSGLARQAQSIAAGLPRDCYDCLRARGWAALAGGDRKGASAWFAAAIAAGPGLAAAHVDQAEARLQAGQPAGALDMARAAARLAPNWSDPRKLAGDALVASGRFAEAEGEYAAAATLAPRWGALHLRWADCLWRLGQRDAARAKLAAAATMDLGPGERALFDRMRAKAQARP
jgi:tetratricopeptide (TPR) repeat protein